MMMASKRSRSNAETAMLRRQPFGGLRTRVPAKGVVPSWSPSIAHSVASKKEDSDQRGKTFGRT